MGADIFFAVQSIGQPVDPIEGLAKHEFVTWEYAVKTWTDVVRRLKLAREVGGSPKDGEEVLKVREFASLRRLTKYVTSLNDSPCSGVLCFMNDGCLRVVSSDVWFMYCLAVEFGFSPHCFDVTRSCFRHDKIPHVSHSAVLISYGNALLHTAAASCRRKTT